MDSKELDFKIACSVNLISFTMLILSSSTTVWFCMMCVPVLCSYENEYTMEKVKIDRRGGICADDSLITKGFNYSVGWFVHVLKYTKYFQTRHFCWTQKCLWKPWALIQHEAVLTEEESI